MFDIYYDSLTEADWFSNLNKAFDFDINHYVKIAARGKNPPVIEQITAYDKPDIILLGDNKPLLVLEKTQEVPTGHNVGQRFARLVRAIEMGVPTIYFFPFDARKHGKYSNICNLNIRLLKAAEIMLEIHRTPLLCINWPTDSHGELVVDGTENDTIRNVLGSYVESGFDKDCEGIRKHISHMKEEYSARLKIEPSYSELPPSVKCYGTSSFISKFSCSGLPSSFINRERTFVYTMEMKPDKCKRQDPYTGTAFLYDYLRCRKGDKVGDKSNNLVLYFPLITKATWNRNNPNDSGKKSCNWYLTANMLLFRDGFILIRG